MIFGENHCFETFVVESDQNEVFQDLGEIYRLDFFDFLPKFTVVLTFKIYFNDFFWENFVLKFLGHKGPKMKFLKSLKNQCMILFWFFEWSYSREKLQYSSYRSYKIGFRYFFWGKSCTQVFEQKGAETEFFWFHNKSILLIFLIFYLKL